MEISDAFSIEEIYDQVNRILDFAAFKNSPTLSKFLSFVISETIEKRNEQIKEYSIALNVLHRPTDFNPHDDAVVRIHAGRLRRALNEYYFTTGISDSIIIDIPKGSYVPKFHPSKTRTTKGSSPAPAPEADIKPVVVIFPLKITPHSDEGSEFGSVLREQLSADLSRFEDVTVIGYYSDEVAKKIGQNILEAGKMVRADYILSGNILISKAITRIRLNLLVVSTGELLMAKTFDQKTPISSMVEIQDQIIKEVTASLGGYSGLLFQKIALVCPIKASHQEKLREGISQYYRYHRYFSIENYRTVFQTMKELVKQQPDSALAWAMLGELYVGGIELEAVRSEDALADAKRCILKSLGLEPLCQHAWYANTLYHLFRRDENACLKSADHCIHLNPNNHALVGGVGFMLICCGFYDQGYPVMAKSVRDNPFYPWWINAGFSFYYLHTGDYEESFRWAEKLHCEEIYWDPLLKCVALAYQEKYAEAKSYLARLLKLEPCATSNINAMLSSLLLSEQLKSRIIGGLKKAGFKTDGRHGSLLSV